MWRMIITARGHECKVNHAAKFYSTLNWSEGHLLVSPHRLVIRKWFPGNEHWPEFLAHVLMSGIWQPCLLCVTPWSAKLCVIMPINLPPFTSGISTRVLCVEVVNLHVPKPWKGRRRPIVNHDYVTRTFSNTSWQHVLDWRTGLVTTALTVIDFWYLKICEEEPECKVHIRGKEAVCMGWFIK